MGVQLVWLKRDLRLGDHAPLAEAAARGRCLVLYVYEPEVVQGAEFDAAHLEFINSCLAELDDGLRAVGGRLTTRVGRVPDVFVQLRSEVPFEAIWSHEETGLWVTYQRDLRVKAWADTHGVLWYEIPQNGVVRRLKSRDGWSAKWQRRMKQPIVPEPPRIHAVDHIVADFDHGRLMSADELGVARTSRTEVQLGGESAARDVLDSFLSARGVNYRADMSSPVEGWDGCSRLSPYLAWGAISVRQIHQALETRRAALKAERAAGRDVDSRWLKSLTSFAGRLRWHCHFMQKLEDEPRLEFENMNRGYDGLREEAFDAAHFAAWQRGETGYPMVDACMRCLHRTGWINFRMRAMLVSFASYHLWLHWREPAVYLGRQFLDFEPGIHFTQFQMQSGVTGMNTIRIYSPAKQVKDQDPRGIFIKRWVPELRDVPAEHLAEPHLMPPLLQQGYGCVIGRDYPAPVVDPKAAYQNAKQRMFAARKWEAVRAEADKVYERHGSRRRPGARGGSSRRTAASGSRGAKASGDTAAKSAP